MYNMIEQLNSIKGSFIYFFAYRISYTVRVKMMFLLPED